MDVHHRRAGRAAHEGRRRARRRHGRARTRRSRCSPAWPVAAAADGLPSERRVFVSLAGSAVAALVNVAQNALVSGTRREAMGKRAREPRPVPAVRRRRPADRDRRRQRRPVAQLRCGRSGSMPRRRRASRDERRPARAPRDRGRRASAVGSRERPAAEWLAALAAAGVPAGIVRSVREALADVNASPLTGVAPSAPGAVRLPPPMLDEHGALVRAHGWDAFRHVASRRLVIDRLTLSAPQRSCCNGRGPRPVGDAIHRQQDEAAPVSRCEDRQLGIAPGVAHDAFAGTAAVGRALKADGWRVHSSDLMTYSYVMQRAYVVALTARSDFERSSRPAACPRFGRRSIRRRCDRPIAEYLSSRRSAARRILCAELRPGRRPHVFHRRECPPH